MYHPVGGDLMHTFREFVALKLRKPHVQYGPVMDDDAPLMSSLWTAFQLLFRGV